MTAATALNGRQQQHRTFIASPPRSIINKRRGPASTDNVDVTDRGFDKRYTTQKDFERSGRGRLPQDHEITDPQIMVIDNGAEEGPLKTSFVLSKIQDHETLRMIRPYIPANPKGQPPTPVRYAVCKILDKKAEYQKQKELKERKKNAVTVKRKELEFSWAIDDHDLETKMKRMAKFLEDGMKVEVVLGKKRGGKKATQEEMEKVIKRVRLEAEEKGGREAKAASGALGASMRLFFEGRRQQA